MAKAKASVKNKSTYTPIPIILLVVLSVILFFPPFLRGLFFEKEQFVVEICTFIVFILFWGYKLVRREKSFIRTPIELASLGLFLLYAISIIYAVSTRDAISEWLKYCMYFSIFFMLTELLATYKLRKAFLWVVCGISVLLCLVGIDGAAGANITNGINQILKAIGAKNDLFFDTFAGGRIYSSLQYPNALASYVIATVIIIVGLGAAYTNKWVKVITGTIASLFVLTFILTISRGAYILVPVALVVLFITLPKGCRVKMFVLGLVPAIIAIPFSVLITNAAVAEAGRGLKVWGLTVGCMIVSGTLAYGYSYISNWLEKISWKVYMSVIVGFIILFGIGAVIAVNVNAPLVLEHKAAEADSSRYIQKGVTLKPGKDYTLQVEVGASSSEEKPYTYQIAIDNKSIQNIFKGGQTQLAIFSDKDTQEVKNIHFTVPEDSEEILITLKNYYKGTKVTFNKAVILDKATNKIVKRLKLNYKYIPRSIAQRFENLGADASNIQRQIYFKDAADMIKDRLILGGGGKAWEKLYYTYQSFGYASTQAHNYFLQVAVEGGIVGIAILLMLVISIIYMFIKRRDSVNSEEKILQAALLTAIISMLVHSAMDFDFSLSAVFLLFWQLLAVYNSMYRHSARNKLPGVVARRLYKLQINPVIAIIVLVVIVFFPISYRAAISHGEANDRYTKEKKAELAFVEIRKASSLDPLNSQYNTKYLNYLLTKQNITKSEMEQVSKLTTRIEKASKHDANVATNYAISLLSSGNINKGMEYVNLGIKLRPHYPIQWNTKVNACYQIAMMLLANGDKEKALEYVNKGLTVMEEAREINKLSLVPFTPEIAIMSDLEKLKYIEIFSKNDKSIDVNTILFYNIARMDINNDNIPDQWTIDNATILNLAGLDNGMTVSGQKGAIQSRALNFEAGTKYYIGVKLQNANNIDSIPYIITGIMGEKDLLKYQDGVYTATVKAADKATTGNLRIELPEGCVVEEVIVRKVS